MQKRIITSSIVLTMVCAAVFYYDASKFYPEKFKLRGVKASILTVGNKDSATNCYKIIDSVNLSDTTQQLLIALRFNLDYISLKHENFWNVSKDPPGAFGHIDTIVSMDITDGKTGTLDIMGIENAIAYSNFRKNHVVEQIGEFHHSGSNGCFIAQTFNSINEFIFAYNTQNPLNTHQVLNMQDFHFFKISHSLVMQIKEQGSNLKIKFKDGAFIEVPINIIH